MVPFKLVVFSAWKFIQQHLRQAQAKIKLPDINAKTPLKKWTKIALHSRLRTPKLHSQLEVCCFPLYNTILQRHDRYGDDHLTAHTDCYRSEKFVSFGTQFPFGCDSFSLPSCRPATDLTSTVSSSTYRPSMSAQVTPMSIASSGPWTFRGTVMPPISGMHHCWPSLQLLKMNPLDECATILCRECCCLAASHRTGIRKIETGWFSTHVSQQVFFHASTIVLTNFALCIWAVLKTSKL